MNKTNFAFLVFKASSQNKKGLRHLFKPRKHDIIKNYLTKKGNLKFVKEKKVALSNGDIRNLCLIKYNYIKKTYGAKVANAVYQKESKDYIGTKIFGRKKTPIALVYYNGNASAQAVYMVGSSHLTSKSHFNNITNKFESWKNDTNVPKNEKLGEKKDIVIEDDMVHITTTENEFDHIKNRFFKTEWEDMKKIEKEMISKSKEKPNK